MPLWSRTDAARLAALRAGDERAFTELVDELSPRMLKLARVYLTGAATAEEAVQEAWIVVLRSLDRFEGRSSLATWILGIVVNVARARGRHESRSRPFSSLSTATSRSLIQTASCRRITSAGPVIGRSHQRRGPSRRSRPRRPTQVIRETVAALPQTQRAVITLRDMIGCTPEETCNALGLTDTQPACAPTSRPDEGPRRARSGVRHHGGSLRERNGL